MLTLSNLTLGYDRHPIIHHLNAEFLAGDFSALVGPNGAGKSTLIKAIVGQIKPLEGLVQFTGLSKDDIAYLPQLNTIERTFPATVEYFVGMGLWRKTGLFSAFSRSDKQRVNEKLDLVGLQDYAKRSIGTLSGGQFQRMLFARLLLQDAKLILLDEPFVGIDERTTEEMMQLLKAHHQPDMAVIAVVHDLSLVQRYFPSCLLLSRNWSTQGVTEQVLTAENLRKAREISYSLDRNAPVCSHPAESINGGAESHV